MNRLLLLIVLLFSFAVLFSQNEGITGARAFGVAGSSILFQDVWSNQNNPAGLGNLQTWEAGITYENQFLQTELSNKAVAFSLPLSAGNFGLSVNQFGYSNFNQNRIGLAYGKILSNKISMGIQFNYLSTNIGEGYGKSTAISGNIGLIAKINEELSLAAVVINPNKAKFAEFTNERHPTLIKLGLSYNFSKKVMVVSEIAKDIDFNSNVRFGVEYKAIDILYLRAGYATSPSLTSFGFGLNINQFKVDFASGFDSNFGFSPQISLVYKPKKITE